MTSFPIDGTSYSSSWILKALPFEEIQESDVTNVTISNINDGNGFVSQILKVTIHLLRSPNPISVILKVPDSKLIHDSFAETAQDGNAAYFNREIEFYRAFLPHLTIPIPQIFKTALWVPGVSTGALLMEDLSQSCYIQAVSHGLSLEQLLAIAGHLAELHNSYLALDDRLKVDFERKFAVLEDCIEFRTALFPSKAEELKRKFPRLVDDAKTAAVTRFLKNPAYHRYSSAGVSESLGLPRVPVHGDLWSNNILWRNGADSTVIGAFLDWQGFFIGNLAFDLSRILVLCTSATVRREHTAAVISHYYGKLQKPQFTEDTVVKAVQETMPYQCAHMMFVIMLLESSYSKTEFDEMLSRVVAVLDDLCGHESMFEEE